MKENNETQSLISGYKYSEIEESIRKLSLVTDKQFETIKHEEWYKRLWDVVTFSKKVKLNLQNK